MKLCLYLAALCCYVAFQLTSGKQQVIKVKGQLFCPTNPKQAANVTVLLVDKDFFSGEDEMGKTKTDNNGTFTLTGIENETGKVDPRLKIYHNCNDGLKPGKRRFKFEFPSRYINSNETLDIGRMNLELKPHEEERDLIG